MVFSKALSLCLVSFTLGIAACAALRDIRWCKLDVPNDKAYCAVGDKKYEAKLSDLNGYFATDEESLRKIADKLDECERRPQVE